MANHLETESEPGVTTLMAGIIHDARQLIVQQLTLFKVEVKNDLQRAQTALAPLAAGTCFLAVALFLVALGAVHLLCWAYPEFPMWGACFVVGVLLAAIGFGMFSWSKEMLESINAVPEKSLQSLRENIQWKMKN